MTDERRKELLARVDGVTQTRGVKHLREHFRGERLTQREAILAKCCDCMGYYRDGRADCRMPACPLYPFMPYRAGRDRPSEIDSEGVDRVAGSGLAIERPLDGRGDGGEAP